MATTTNFGWETPDDSDLVKDGAAAMRTLGNSIDASMADLRGGTSGQILSKNSNTDMDFTWIANDQGDITAVTAGTGLTGGGTTGAVTLTNDMATTITAAGDIVVGTGSGTYDNLPIGTTGQVLTADTTVSPYKVKWAAAGSAFVGVKALASGGKTNANATFTSVEFDLEDWDTDGIHSTTTNNSRFTVPSGKGGYWMFLFVVAWQAGTYTEIISRWYKNGVQQADRAVGRPAGSAGNIFPTIFNLAAGDYMEVFTYQDSGGNKNTESPWMSVAYLGA